MRTGNPALSPATFLDTERASSQEDAMTIQGTINKTLVLLLCVLLTTGWTWSLYYKSGNPASVAPWILIGAIGGFVAALVITFKKTWAPIMAPLYALLEGLFIGGVSATIESSYPGIVIQATGLTFGTLACLLFAYRTGLIHVTEKFKLGVIAATGGIAIVYFISIILSLFGVKIPFIYGNGLIGIGVSLFIVIIAALNLVLDFDLIEQGSKSNLPKYMEWYGAFALMVTLIWLYIEILRLLSKIRSR